MDRTVGKTIAVGRTTVVARIAGVMMIAVAVAVVVVEETVVATKVATKTVALAVVMMVTDVMIVYGAVIASPLAMLILLAKFAISMGTRQRIVGGAMEMIAVTMESVETMMHMLIWRHMELIPTGIMTLVPLITLLES